MLVQSFIERLRPLIGLKGWDYVVFWKLSNDHRCIEWMDCCCGGSEDAENVGEEFVNFEGSSSLHCRDIMLPHRRVKACDLLDQLPSSILLDSGIHAQSMLSNQASWLNYSHNSDLCFSEESIGTRVLVPVPLGLVDLFVTKQIPEDEKVVDFITAQCNFFLEQQTMSTYPNDPFAVVLLGTKQMRINLCPSPQQQSKNNGIQGMETAQANNTNNNTNLWAVEDNANEDTFDVRSDASVDDEDKFGRRNGKGPQSKNLMAERKRRKKLNDRLYSLRALVPNISKLDRAAILGDAIDYVNELKQQVEDLQIKLEEHSENEDDRKTNREDEANNPNIMHSQNVTMGKNFMNGFPNTVNNVPKHNYEPHDANDKVQQMEPEVEVFQIDGNEFLVKVFCEHKLGGFVRLMEALNSLGLEVTNVNTTRHTCLVLTIFKVERMNNDAVQAHDVKESLLELTRNPSRNECTSHFPLSHNTTTIDDDASPCGHQFNSHHLHHY